MGWMTGRRLLCVQIKRCRGQKILKEEAWESFLEKR